MYHRKDEINLMSHIKEDRINFANLGGGAVIPAWSCGGGSLWVTCRGVDAYFLMAYQLRLVWDKLEILNNYCHNSKIDIMTKVPKGNFAN